MTDSSPNTGLSDSSLSFSLSGLNKQAINAALEQKWQQAIELNNQILKNDPTNAPCLNRLARALFEVGKYLQSKKIYQKVLSIDPYNTIAQKNLKRISSIKKKDLDKNQKNILPHHPQIISPNFFLEEAGITKVVNLIKLAEPQKLSKLYPGEMVKLIPKNRGVSVTDMDDNYLGVLADDISHLMIKLIKGGNKFQASIKSIKSNALSILVRETFRSRKFKNQSSFLDNLNITTYSSDNIKLRYEEPIPEIVDPDESFV